MNKFTIAKTLNEEKLKDETKPVLYKIHIGNKYYLHKGKVLRDSVEQFFDNVFRGMRGKSCNEAYSKVVEYCKKYPAIYSYTVDIVFNGDPDKLLKLEEKMYKSMAKDEDCINRLDIPPYKPEWMIKATYQARCTECVTHILYGAKGEKSKKMIFKFCPNCGRLNKK